MTALLIGLDLDNTLVCYDEVFHRAALEAGLIPPALPASKGNVRDYLRATGREPEWTALQGRVYGDPALARLAMPFPGALDFVAACRRRGLPVAVVSHRTRRPIAGPPTLDLHAAARDWLEHHGFHDPSRGAVPRESVYLESTKAAKIERIRALGCTHFVDDLPEFLSEPNFPNEVRRILFDPHATHPSKGGLEAVTSWAEIEARILQGRDSA